MAGQNCLLTGPVQSNKKGSKNNSNCIFIGLIYFRGHFVDQEENFFNLIKITKKRMKSAKN